MKLNVSLAPARDLQNSSREQADLFCAKNGP